MYLLLGTRLCRKYNHGFLALKWTRVLLWWRICSISFLFLNSKVKKKIGVSNVNRRQRSVTNIYWNLPYSRLCAMCFKCLNSSPLMPLRWTLLSPVYRWGDLLKVTELGVKLHLKWVVRWGLYTLQFKRKSVAFFIEKKKGSYIALKTPPSCWWKKNKYLSVKENLKENELDWKRVLKSETKLLQHIRLVHNKESYVYES